MILNVQFWRNEECNLFLLSWDLNVWGKHWGRHFFRNWITLICSAENIIFTLRQFFINKHRNPCVQWLYVLYVSSDKLLEFLFVGCLCLFVWFLVFCVWSFTLWGIVYNKGNPTKLEVNLIDFLQWRCWWADSRFPICKTFFWRSSFFTNKKMKTIMRYPSLLILCMCIHKVQRLKQAMGHFQMESMLQSLPMADNSSTCLDIFVLAIILFWELT